ncbi:hypothetical protein QVD17_20737 [Tagetes erecta]|uniref:DUF6817 domain-containing protein n=1 Tax=Tagetes erecta TaxID=13708 RepID=A0AAD8NR97_TARER|nr:hypothetical protein QVD17_20737 [Tagetes erecta]
MPSSSTSISLTNKPNHEHLQSLIESARPFLRNNIISLDKNLPNLLTILNSAGANECWHRLGTFSHHLFHVYRILKLWNVPNPICLFGFFHSVYSNSYHDLAIFNPETDRETVRQHVGNVAENLIYLFCVVPRHTLIHDDLVFKYTDYELREDLRDSEQSLNSGNVKQDEKWRKKVQEVAPETGILTTHIRTGEPVVIPRRVLAVFLLMTIADFGDQYYGYQDDLYDNTNGRLEFTGNTNFDVLWPGNGKPGLWMNLVSKMAAVYTLLVREEQILMQQKRPDPFEQPGRVKQTDPLERPDLLENGWFEEVELVIPPVFEGCTKVLDPNEQIKARDIYWEVVYNDEKFDKEKSEEMLVKCIEMNPFVGEPHVLLSQFYMSRGRFEEGEREGELGLGLLLEWGCCWDKRVSWEGWVAWCRVLLSKAKERSWPKTSWGIISLGLVK